MKSQQVLANGVLGRLKNVWDYLTAPPADITDPLERQRARILSSLSLIYFLPSSVILFIRVLSSGLSGGTGVTWVAVMITYILSRTRFRRFGAYILIASIYLSVALLLPAADTLATLFSVAILLPVLLVLPIAFAMLIMSAVEVTVFGIFALLLMVGIAVRSTGYHGVIDYGDNITVALWVPVIVSIVVMGITTLVSFLRQRDLATIQTQYAELQGYSKELENRVEERTQELRLAKDEAEAARERAEESDRVKSQFLASMSHELRTPLNAILNFTEMTALGYLGPVNEGQKDALIKSLDSGRHLLSLINDVLDITKMHSGMMALFIEDGVDLNAELKSVIATAQTLLRGKSVQFVTDVDEGLPVISGDKRRIRQILLNLISNAAKFTEEGSITLSAKRREGEVLFAVTDTGPGIAKEEQEIIFEPFVQSQTGIKHAGGTGLGLPISKYLAAEHGGRMWLESEPGDGAAFYVTLPVKPLAIVEK